MNMSRYAYFPDQRTAFKNLNINSTYLIVKLSIRIYFQNMIILINCSVQLRWNAYYISTIEIGLL